MKNCTLIADIGKTNKKLYVFAENFDLLFSQEASFPETLDDGGFPADDLANWLVWLEEGLRQAVSNPEWQISRINFSGYGATLVHTDPALQPVGPLFNYLRPFPEYLAEPIFARHGSPANFCRETASPYLGMLNTGLQLLWLQAERPAIFQASRYSLHLPQFLAALVHGKPFSELTSLGCHTMLWDFEQNGYHAWVSQQGLADRLPPIVPATHTEQVVFHGRPLSAGVGLHDSSAALVPYLAAVKAPFLLLSTGTWSIALNPFSQEPLTEAELRQDCLFFLSYEGRPVKASRAFLGHEHALQTGRIAHHFGVSPDFYQRVAFQPAIIEDLLATPRPDWVPAGLEGTGPFPRPYGSEWNLAAFASAEEAYHQLMLGLCWVQRYSLDLLDPDRRIGQVMLSGGFLNNDLFVRLLSGLCPERRIITSGLSYASALGAALAAGHPMPAHPEQLLQLSPQPAVHLSGLAAYQWQPGR